jgi:peptide/nickel transport system permease protein
LIQYIIRRIGALLLVLLGSTFLIYNLTAISGDPLEDLRLSTEPNAQILLQQAIEKLQLDIPPPVRYFNWLMGILGLGGAGASFGLTVDGDSNHYSPGNHLDHPVDRYRYLDRYHQRASSVQPL